MRVRLGSSRHALPRPRAAADSADAAPALRLPDAYDLLDVPAAAGHRVLLQLERLGTPLGPVLTVQAPGAGYEGRFQARGRSGRREGRGDGAGPHEAGGSRLRFFVEAGTTASFLADLKDLGWEPDDTDIRTIGVVRASETSLPAAGSPRWVRPPESGRAVVLPPARLLLGALAHACRRPEPRRAHALFAGSRSD